MRTYFPPSVFLLLLSVSVFWADVSSAADAPKNNSATHRLTLSAAEDMALRYSYGIRIARQNRNVASGRIMKAYGEALPVVLAEFSRTRDDSENADTHDQSDRWREGYDGHVSVTQPLFKGGKTFAAIRAARKYRDYVNEGVRGSEQDLLYQVRLGYYGLLLQQEYVRVSTGQVALARSFHEDMQKRLTAGSVAELDVLRARVELANEEAVLIKDKNQLRIDRAAFLRLLGLPLDDALQLVDAFPSETSMDEQEEVLVRRASNLRTDYRQAGLSIGMQEENIRAVRSELFPKIELQGTYGGVTGSWSTDSEDWTEDWGVGIKISMMLFDGLAIRGQIREEKAVLEQMRLQKEDLKDAIQLDVRSALYNIQSAREFVRSQKENVHQAETVLTQEQLRNQQGANIYLDILNARQNLAQAQRNYYSALHDLAVTREQLRKAVGTIGEEKISQSASEVPSSCRSCAPVTECDCNETTDAAPAQDAGDAGVTTGAMVVPESSKEDVLFSVESMPGAEEHVPGIVTIRRKIAADVLVEAEPGR